MTLETLLRLLAALGVRLAPSAVVGAPLYVHHAAEGGRIAYAGLDLSADGGRAAREERWIEGADPSRELRVGFVRMAKALETSCTRLEVVDSAVDPSQALELAADWSGPGIDRFRQWAADGPVLTPEQLETLIVRVLVASGIPVANAAKAGQWDAYLGRPLDTAAQLAVIAAGDR